MKQFSGTGVALVTPFKSGKINYKDLEKIIEYQINGGIDYLVSLGTTGEATMLSNKECQNVLDFTVKTVNGRVPIVAGNFGASNTAVLIERVHNYNLEGISAIMSSSPSYVKPNQEGIFRHYMELEKESPLPIIIYNVPGRTSSNIAATTTLRLANASDKFIAIKEATGDIVQAAKIIKEKPANFLVLSGDDPTALALIACGAEGVISVIANAFPSLFSDMVRAALNNDYKTAQHLNLQLIDIHHWLYVDGNPVGIKAALEMLGLCRKEVRLPLAPISKPNFIQLKKEISKVLITKGININ